MAKLTDKQKKFVEEYLIDLNATQAAIRAGYKKSEYTDTNANKLLENTRIAEAIAKAMAERSRRTGISQDRVVNELAKIAFVNMLDVVDEEGRIRSTASEDDLACIESIKHKESSSINGDSTEREVKIASKLKALELLGKHLGMWNDKLDVNMNVPIIFEGEQDIAD